MRAEQKRLKICFLWLIVSVSTVEHTCMASNKREIIGTCRGSLYECPFVQRYQEKLIKSNFSNGFIGKTNNSDNIWNKINRASSAKPDMSDMAEADKLKMLKNKTNEIEKSKDEKEDRASSVAVIRSTRAQDLRSQCNRDLLKPKSVCEKTRMSSPYVSSSSTTQKKKRTSMTPTSDSRGLSNRSLPSTKYAPEEKKKNSKSQNTNQTGDNVRKQKREKLIEVSAPLHREKTQDVVCPKVIKKKSMDDCGDKPRLQKSQTFFICKGPKRGEGDDVTENKNSSSESEYEDPPPEPSPLTHNDSFCLIAKSSQNWSQKKRFDGENLYPQTVVIRNKPKKDDKGILKSSNRDLKSVDSLEKIEPEKIVRFSDELIRKRKILRKYIRRKNKLQNSITTAWYRKNKMFQKYLQVLKAKSVLHAGQEDLSPNSKQFQVPAFVKERYEAEMLGIAPRKSRKGRPKKDTY